MKSSCSPTSMSWRAGTTAIVLGAALVLAGCQGSRRPEPTPLVSFTPSLQAPLAWNKRVGSVVSPLMMNVVGKSIVVADRDGNIASFDVATGNEAWRVSAGDRLSAGVGSDGHYTSVVTRDNQLMVFEGNAVKWKQALPTRVTTPPLVAGERVFVLGVDRIVRAFDAADGRRLWTQQRPGDALSLLQAGVVMPFQNTLLVGQGSRLAALEPDGGTVLWDVPVSTPRGTNEVERLADLVAPTARVGDVVCARSFGAAVSCLNAARGVLLWTRAGGGDEGVAADADYVFGADSADRVMAWKFSGGDVAWTTQSYLYRNFSAPAVLPKAVVFGDSQGLVHFLARDTGQTVQRLATDGSPIETPPVVVDGTLVVATRNGGLYAFRPQ